MVESATKLDLRCSVCFDEKSWQENPLVTCTECSLTVHQACYGILLIPQGSWLCQTCESQERMARVKCELCPLKGGALKKTDTNGWAHVVCALYIPEVRFADTRTMEPIIISRIPREKFSKSCHICDEGNQERKAIFGACMNCNWSNCKISFHVTCGQKFGLLTEEEDSRDGSSVRYCGYCPTHLTRIAMNDRRKTITSSAINTSTLCDTKLAPNKRKVTSNHEGTKSKRPTYKHSDSSDLSPSREYTDSESSSEVPKQKVSHKKILNKHETTTTTTTTTTAATTTNKQKHKVNKDRKETVIKSKVHPLSRHLSKTYSQSELRQKVIVPDSLEKMLDKQWEQTSEFICNQGTRLGEIDTLLTSLHRLQNENNDLRNSMHTLSIKTDRYQSSNLYLSSLLTMHAVGQISLKIPQFKPPEICPPKINKPRKRISKDLKCKITKRRSKKLSELSPLKDKQTCQEDRQQKVELSPQENIQIEPLNSQLEPTNSKPELTPED
ncbi:Protein AF-10 isoform X2 [Oopsacas minuta]|uniref:Protein AF-10 isoform X2 n=1 Tax=Oopsacas minuta TaxID=111878 RepID=A0AAV7KED6_9METZ|nr:Protein AF-10 isoform X2 [Oopsacas minuta]